MPRSQVLLASLLALVLMVPLAGCGGDEAGTAVADDQGKGAQQPPPPALPGPKALGGGRPQLLIKTSHGDMVVELFHKQAPKTVKNFVDLAEGRRYWKDPRSGKQVQRPFFDGLTFHRVIPDFMIQGGDPLANGQGGPGYFFEDELSARSLGLDKMKAFIPQGNSGAWHRIIQTAGGPTQIQQKLLIPLYKELGIPTKPGQPYEAERQRKLPLLKERLRSLTVEEALTIWGYTFQNELESTPPSRGMLAMANAGPKTNGSQFFLITGNPTYLTGKHTVFGQVIEGIEVADKISRERANPRNNKPIKPVVIHSVREVKAEVESGKK